MTELERRALLGDKQAQEECTQKGIVLPCPMCSGTPVVKVKKAEYGLSGTIIRCNVCGVYLFSPDAKAKSVPGAIRNVPIKNHKKIGIERWNTRPASPLGRCIDCANVCEVGDNLVTCDIFERDMMPGDFCSQFEAKEREHIGMDKR